MPRGVRYSKDVRAEVVRRTAAGESLPLIAQAAGMPQADTVRHWIETEPAFAAEMLSAREEGGSPVKGRPPLWCVETADEILRRVAAGEWVVDICRDAHLPCATTVWNWKRRYPEFRAAMADAQEVAAERLVAGGMKLAMTLAEQGWGEGRGVEPGRAYACDVMLKHLRWTASRSGPKAWGARRPAAPEAEPQVKTLVVKTLVIGAGEDGEPTVYWIAPNPDTGVVERVDDGKWPGVEKAAGFVGKPGNPSGASAGSQVLDGPASSLRSRPEPGGAPDPLGPGGVREKPWDPEGWC